ncbi:DUF6588 family protein [Uliginosibacterium sp. TH139]|uniref:DUF6588 family protein n=1 Tax=Uliginosibacterium sp. TH139 TaxID=2067453 RepID=UPI000C7C171F|nr:DUF6588 family protein [Uliginosibacterium sp. TH139]PLK47395.1 hypothetical protein C0V76_17220 [Uliginosibacterium sp. TH139]
MSKLMAALLAAFSAASSAAGLENLGQLSQTEFEQLSGDLVSALSYKAISPGDPLGLLGFDVALEATATRLSNPDVMRAAGGQGYQLFGLPRLDVHKGLPLALDVGAFYAPVPGMDASLYGAELRWSPMEGSLVLPAVSLRGAYTVLSGSEQLDFHAANAEIVVSKGFLFFKPYVGAGLVHGTSTPLVSGLAEVSQWQRKFFAGANLNLGLFNLALEIDRTGHANSYSAKAGFRF